MAITIPAPQLRPSPLRNLPAAIEALRQRQREQAEAERLRMEEMRARQFFANFLGAEAFGGGSPVNAPIPALQALFADKLARGVRKEEHAGEVELKGMEGDAKRDVATTQAESAEKIAARAEAGKDRRQDKSIIADADKAAADRAERLNRLGMELAAKEKEGERRRTHEESIARFKANAAQLLEAIKGENAVEITKLTGQIERDLAEFEAKTTRERDEFGRETQLMLQEGEQNSMRSLSPEAEKLQREIRAMGFDITDDRELDFGIRVKAIEKDLAKFVNERLTDEGYTGVQFGFDDIQGALRSVIVPAMQRSILEEGKYGLSLPDAPLPDPKTIAIRTMESLIQGTFRGMDKLDTLPEIQRLLLDSGMSPEQVQVYLRYLKSKNFGPE